MIALSVEPLWSSRSRNPVSPYTYVVAISMNMTTGGGPSSKGSMLVTVCGGVIVRAGGFNWNPSLIDAEKTLWGKCALGAVV